MQNIFLFKIDSSNEAINIELTNAMQNALHTDIETNNWATVELTDGLGSNGGW